MTRLAGIRHSRSLNLAAFRAELHYAAEPVPGYLFGSRTCLLPAWNNKATKGHSFL